MQPLKSKINQLADLYLNDYEQNKRKTIKEAKYYTRLIKDYFWYLRASQLTTGHVSDYRAKRKDEEVQDSTINREIAALKRMYNIGMEHDPPLVLKVPKFKFIAESNIRTGFFEDDEFLALRGALPDHAKVIVTIAYYTGMRLGEILGLRWNQVDFQSQTIRLNPGSTKNNEGRIIPMYKEVKEALEMWKMLTVKKWPNTPWVSHYKGK